MTNKAAVIGIDSVYIPVSDRQQAEHWYALHLGLEPAGDYLRAGRQEVFLRERLDEQVLSFRTNQWLANGDSYEMPVVCFRANDIDGLHAHAVSQGIRTGPMTSHSWFKEFDLYDPDGNKLKLWQPNE